MNQLTLGASLATDDWSSRLATEFSKLLLDYPGIFA
jgi:hypothetical protein